MKSNLACYYSLLCINFKWNAERELKLLNARKSDKLKIYIKLMGGNSFIVVGTVDDNNNNIVKPVLTERGIKRNPL